MQGIEEGNLHLVLVYARESLLSKGALGIRCLSRVFREMGSFDGNCKVDRDEFVVGLRECGANLSSEQLGLLFACYDVEQDGMLDFSEFLKGIRGSMNPRRQDLVYRAFAKFDREGTGRLNCSDFRGVYNGSMHPKVQKGEMTDDQVLSEFISNFTCKNGLIEQSEWNDYYSAVSASIENDEHFVLLMKLVWRLD